MSKPWRDPSGRPIRRAYRPIRRAYRAFDVGLQLMWLGIIALAVWRAVSLYGLVAGVLVTGAVIATGRFVAGRR